jgi:hypothetical protein
MRPVNCNRRPMARVGTEEGKIARTSRFSSSKTRSGAPCIRTSCRRNRPGDSTPPGRCLVPAGKQAPVAARIGRSTGIRNRASARRPGIHARSSATAIPRRSPPGAGALRGRAIEPIRLPRQPPVPESYPRFEPAARAPDRPAPALRHGTLSRAAKDLPTKSGWTDRDPFLLGSAGSLVKFR